MSRTAKLILWIVVIILVVIIVKAMMGGSSVEAPVVQNEAPKAAVNQAVDKSVSDTSDAGIANDTANIDAEMNGLTSDSASADQALSVK